MGDIFLESFKKREATKCLKEWGHSDEPSDEEMAYGYKNDYAKKLGYSGINDPEFVAFQKKQEDERNAAETARKEKEAADLEVVRTKRMADAEDRKSKADPADYDRVKEYFAKFVQSKYNLGNRDSQARNRALYTILHNQQRLERNPNAFGVDNPNRDIYLNDDLFDILLDLIVNAPDK